MSSSSLQGADKNKQKGIFTVCGYVRICLSSRLQPSKQHLILKYQIVQRKEKENENLGFESFNVESNLTVVIQGGQMNQ